MNSALDIFIFPPEPGEAPKDTNLFIFPPEPITPFALAPKEVEVDFGTAPFQTYNIFNVVDAAVTTASKILLTKAIKTPSDGRPADELFVETLDLSAKANSGNFDLYVRSIVGTLSGKFIINYTL